MFTNQTTLPFAAWNQQLSEVDLSYAPDFSTLMVDLKPTGLPSFTPDLLSDISRYQQLLKDFLSGKQARSEELPVRYVVHYSSIPGIFNLGGDLARFARLIRAGAREQLLQYAKACIDVLHTNHVHMDSPVTTIALVDGTAAGGGFEAVLSNEIIIAERGVEMGFPETIFNLFPGMGAYSFLTRRVSPVIAERIIKSGRMYKAEELYELGLVDELAEPGEGKSVLTRYIRRHAKYANMHQAMRQVKDRVQQVSYAELMDITTIWVEAAVQLPESNIRTMERLVKAQTHRMHRHDQHAAK